MTTTAEIQDFKQKNPHFTATAVANALRTDPAFVRATAARQGWTFPPGPTGRPRNVKLRPASGEIYARAGERTYCKGGHHLGTINRDVKVGQETTGTIDMAPGMSFGMIHCPFCYEPTNLNGCYYFAVTP